jgi:hypothetical protein
MPKKSNNLNKELLAEFRREAKKADMRLKRLETKAAEDPKKYGSVLNYSYKRAVKDINDFALEPIKPGENARFNSLKGVSTDVQLQAKLNAVKRFNESKTSKYADIRKSYEQRAETLNKHYKKEKMDVSANTMAKIFESGLWDKMKTEGFDSDTIMKTISWIGRNKKKLSKKIKKFDEIHLTENEFKFAEGAPTPKVETMRRILTENRQIIAELVNDNWIDASDWEDNPFN